MPPPTTTTSKLTSASIRPRRYPHSRGRRSTSSRRRRGTWFERAFAAPTPAQALGWPAIARRRERPHPGADRLGQDARGVPHRDRPAERRTRRGAAAALRLPAQGAQLRHRAEPAEPARRACARSSPSPSARATRPPRSAGACSARRPDILITTPESLFLLLTSQARETLRGIETVILDEVHAVAGTKRGAHLALSLERLERIVERAVPTDRALRDTAAARGDRPLRRGLGPGDRARRRRRSQGARPRGGRPARGHARARVDRRALGAAARRRRPDGRRSGAVEPLDLALDLSCDPRAGPASTARRSCSSTTAAWPSGSRCA